MKKYLPLLILFIAMSCSEPTQVDCIVKGKIYTVDDESSIVEAVAINDGKIVAVGSSQKIEAEYEAEDLMDFGDKPVYPGFYDAHCHFLGYGLTLQEANLVGTTSIDEVVERLKIFADEHPGAEWIIGRGWDQNDWSEKQFPDFKALDEIFPDKPVYLVRIDGHAAWVNSAAIKLAKVTANTQVEGGDILKNNNGLPKGILIDKAMQLVADKIPEASIEKKTKALLEAQKNCFAVGLTTVSDAGLPYQDVKLIDSLHRDGQLLMNMYVMLTPTQETIENLINKGPFITDKLTVRSIKLFSDGALGSRGAYLVEPYHDDPHNHGLRLLNQEELMNMAKKAYDNEYQLNVHCIGDAANKYVLDAMAEVLKPENDNRWRIEHAQIVQPADISIYKQYNIIPSVQPTHATSDMYWAEQRLGPERIKTAYAYQQLLDAVGLLAIGSDFPVEDINPMLGFHAAVARQDAKGYPDEGFQPENAISREDALKGMTIWAAFANFEEGKRGSIVPGKHADFTVLEEDIMTVALDKIPEIKVAATIINGEKVY